MNRKQAFIDFVNDLIKNCKYPVGMSEDAEFYWNYLKNSNDDEIKKIVRELFYGILTPQFLWRKVISIRNFDDVKFLFTYAVKYVKKLKDFSQN